MGIVLLRGLRADGPDSPESDSVFSEKVGYHTGKEKGLGSEALLIYSLKTGSARSQVASYGIRSASPGMVFIRSL
jgi:hypothetical protein